MDAFVTFYDTVRVEDVEGMTKEEIIAKACQMVENDPMVINAYDDQVLSFELESEEEEDEDE